MYIDKDIVYADAGFYLKKGHKTAFQLKAEEGVVEHELKIDDLIIENNIAFYNDHKFTIILNKKWGYGDYKREIIKKRYSNDDQIAIMLNKDDSKADLVRYNKMAEWREFASKLAQKIVEKTKE